MGESSPLFFTFIIMSEVTDNCRDENSQSKPIDLLAMWNFIASLDDPRISWVNVYSNIVQVQYQF